MENRERCLINAYELITLPDVYHRIKQVLEDENHDADTIANTLMLDPGISSRILRLANSAFFGQQSKVDSMERATTLLGEKLIHDIVLASSLEQCFENLPATSIDVREFWMNSLEIAAYTKACAEVYKLKNKDDMFLYGLLANIGHMAMMITLPEEMARIYAFRQKHEQAPHLIERAVLGFDHAEISAELLNAWKLPEVMTQSIRYQHTPEHAQNYIAETSCLYVARQIIDTDDFPNSLQNQTLEEIGLAKVNFEETINRALEIYEQILVDFGFNEGKISHGG